MIAKWRIEESSHPGSGARWWAIARADTGGIWGYFFDRVAATACLRGFAEIGFVPDPSKATAPGESLEAICREMIAREDTGGPVFPDERGAFVERMRAVLAGKEGK